MKNNILALLALTLVSPLATASSIDEAMNKSGRLESDIARDGRSHPEAVLPLLELEPGDRVADIWAGGGYYSELIASIVGEKGEVLLVNNKAYAQFAGKAIARRFDERERPGSTTY